MSMGWESSALSSAGLAWFWIQNRCRNCAGKNRVGRTHLGHWVARGLLLACMYVANKWLSPARPCRHIMYISNGRWGCTPAAMESICWWQDGSHGASSAVRCFFTGEQWTHIQTCWIRFIHSYCLCHNVHAWFNAQHIAQLTLPSPSKSMLTARTHARLFSVDGWIRIDLVHLLICCKFISLFKYIF